MRRLTLESGSVFLYNSFDSSSTFLLFPSRPVWQRNDTPFLLFPLFFSDSPGQARHGTTARRVASDVFITQVMTIEVPVVLLVGDLFFSFFFGFDYPFPSYLSLD